MYAIEAEQLTKHYKIKDQKEKLVALNKLDLVVEEGEIFGFLGPNGAGKTTFIKILVGLIFPSSGRAKILSESIYDAKVRRKLGYLPEISSYPNYMPAYKLLRFYGTFFNLKGEELEKKCDEVLGVVGLKEKKKVRLKEYSKGMLQRFGIAQSLINDPDILILDEPTEGLDPFARKEVKDVILQLKKRGKTILFSSHILSETETICDNICILNKGEKLYAGKISTIIEKRTEEKAKGFKIQAVIGQENTSALESLSLQDKMEVIPKEGKYYVTLTVPDPLPAVILIEQKKGEIISVMPLRKSLEDIFFEIIKEHNKR